MILPPSRSGPVSRLDFVFASYRDVLTQPGAMAFSAAGFVARLPISMVTLAIVLLIAQRSGSYGFAGAVSAAYMLATSAASPVLARLIDQWGQRRVLMPACTVFAAGLLGLVTSVQLEWATPLPHLFAALAGFGYPPVGACVRARWTHLLGPGRELHTAFSVEAVVDESIFIVGPVIVTVLATQVHEMAGIAAVVACALVGGFWFTGLRATQPPVRLTRRRRVDRDRLNWAWMSPMIMVAICLGSLFGSTEVVTVAFAEEQGHPKAIAVLLAVWATGSLIAGVLTGLASGGSSTLRRYRLGALGMAAAMIPLPFVDNLVVLGGVLFLGGFAISPTMVAAMSLVEANVTASRLTEGITWVTTGIGLGIAPGAAIAGQLIDEVGASTAYFVPAVSGILAAVIAATTGTPVSAGEHAFDTV